jgi:hypothetical protein
MILFVFFLQTAFAFPRKGFVKVQETPQDFYSVIVLKLEEIVNCFIAVAENFQKNFKDVAQVYGIGYLLALGVVFFLFRWKFRSFFVKLSPMIQKSSENISILSQYPEIAFPSITPSLNSELSELENSIKTFKTSISTFQSEVFSSHVVIWKSLSK